MNIVFLKNFISCLSVKQICNEWFLEADIINKAEGMGITLALNYGVYKMLVIELTDKLNTHFALQCLPWRESSRFAMCCVFPLLLNYKSNITFQLVNGWLKLFSKITYHLWLSLCKKTQYLQIIFLLKHNKINELGWTTMSFFLLKQQRIPEGLMGLTTAVTE